MYPPENNAIVIRSTTYIARDIVACLTRSRLLFYFWQSFNASMTQSRTIWREPWKKQSSKQSILICKALWCGTMYSPTNPSILIRRACTPRANPESDRDGGVHENGKTPAWRWDSRSRLWSLGTWHLAGVDKPSGLAQAFQCRGRRSESGNELPTRETEKTRDILWWHFSENKLLQTASSLLPHSMWHNSSEKSWGGSAPRLGSDIRHFLQSVRASKPDHPAT